MSCGFTAVNLGFLFCLFVGAGGGGGGGRGGGAFLEQHGLKS